MRHALLLLGLAVGWGLNPALLVADGESAVQIVGAELTERTGRYGHNVLGGNEYAAMVVTILPGEGAAPVTRRVDLLVDRVFEDIKARPADVTGDGINDVVVVEASTAGGAELAVYGLAEGDAPTLRRLASTPPIGRRNRWLSPAGIADFDGDGQNDIAYVETPHLGGTLRIWTMREGDLVQLASARGFSNHRIGEDFITGGVRDCGSGPELVLPNFAWTHFVSARLVDGQIISGRITNGLDTGDLEDLPRHLTCGDVQ